MDEPDRKPAKTPGRDRGKDERRQELEDIKALMSTPSGRRLFRRLQAASKIFDPGLFTGNSYTYYNLGLREIGLTLYSDVMEVCPELWTASQQEYIKELSNDNRK